ncbi:MULTISPECIES: primosomal protein DnaI [Bacillus cereus group]|uniref:Primosomal protein DnaI n=2 Tax=Bacillus cereus group TaxID=86661 RepID=A0A9W5VUW5_BACCE|nr:MULTISPECIES: primosomal protein DnaI [Bacillus cereus group]EOQ19566.1 hypothetical protein IKC_04040 [Bacillus cereus VD184]OUB76833.1 prepilin peptidase [Bacillus thuringiensis serovar jegathesan]HDR4588671.1 primosomal protein DnaI [Bacillus cytotoxicus]
MKESKDVLSAAKMSFDMKAWKEQMEKTMNQPYVQDFRERFPNVAEHEIFATATRFLSAMQEEENCKKCMALQLEGNISELEKLKYRLANCPNGRKGKRFEIIANEANRIEEITVQCNYDKQFQQLTKEASLIKAVHTPKRMLDIDLKDIVPHKSRKNALEAIFTFIQEMKTNGTAEGVYLYGDFGVGKSYLVAFAAKTLALEGIETTIVYVPEFFREIKSSIKDGTIEEKIQFAKETQVLVLDDICAEQLTPWLRDEVLGPILQYRYVNELPTLFTSNCDKNELEVHLTKVYRRPNDLYDVSPEMEKRNAQRIMQRIEFTTKFVEVIGENLRRKYK